MDQRKKELIAAYKSRPLTAGVTVIRNSINGRYLLETPINPRGTQNRFAFSQNTDNCVYAKLQADWKAFGKDAFTFEILEEIEQIPEQTPEEFKSDLETLGALWAAKFDPALSY